jgi:molybdopterin synthase catalytic subunit
MIRVDAKPFDPQAELAAFSAGHTEAGALASFIGLCRGEDGAVSTLELDHYPGFTEREIARIASEARTKFDVQHLLVIHRAGVVTPGERLCSWRCSPRIASRRWRRWIS